MGRKHTLTHTQLKKKLRRHNRSAIDMSSASPGRGHVDREVRRSTGHIMVTNPATKTNRDPNRDTTSCPLPPIPDLGYESGRAFRAGVGPNSSSRDVAQPCLCDATEQTIVVVVFFTLTDGASTIPSTIIRGCQSDTVRGHKEVPRSTGHIMVTTRY